MPYDTPPDAKAPEITERPKGPFIIVRGALQRDGSWRDVDGGGLFVNVLFPSPNAARHWWRRYQGRPATIHMAVSGYYVRPATWKEREGCRMGSGFYKSPVWSGEGWWREAMR